jgi:hypothetical protein
MVVMALLSFLTYNSLAFDGCSSMSRKKGLVTLCLLVFSLQSSASAPLATCVENCHSWARSCHLGEKQEFNSQACPHSKAVPGSTLKAKFGCDCAIRAHQSPAKETVFTLDSWRTEISKLSVADCDSSSKTVPSLMEARLHSPPRLLRLSGQNTFLLNSNLRI